MKLRGVPFAILVSALLTGCGGAGQVNAVEEPVDTEDPLALVWVSPSSEGENYACEVVALTVSTYNSEAKVIHFAVDGAEVAVCDPGAAQADCHQDDLWSSSVSLAAGSHVLLAWFPREDGTRVEATETIEILPAPTTEEAP